MGINLTREEFLAKFEFVPNIIRDWADDIGGLQGKTILDFGCGEGLQAAGITKAHNPRSVVGVDIFEEFQALPNILSEHGEELREQSPSFHRIKPGESLPVRSVDMIYSWSVFEHVDVNIFDRVVADLHSVLTDGGHMFVQIAPLYFSPEGSHLWAIGYRNWEHLTKQIDHIHKDLYSGAISKDLADHLWSTFITLNRITPKGLVKRIERGGFQLLRKAEMMTDKDPPEHLLNAYSEHALKTDQIVALFQKTSLLSP